MATANYDLLNAFLAADNHHHPINSGPAGPDPEQAIVRRISMKKTDKMLEFFFTVPKATGPLPTGGIRALVEELRGLPIVDTGTESPLDLNVKAPSYVVFMLSKDWDWKFFPDAKAVSLKKRDHGDRYGGLRHVPDMGEPSIDAVNNCRMIYFVAHPLPENMGNAPQQGYGHGFNLYVDLAQPPNPDTGAARVLKIIIDPDIRNPGGSED